MLILSALTIYKTFHSIETVLLFVQHDILNSMRQGKVMALTILDRLTPLDNIVHTIILDRLLDW